MLNYTLRRLFTVVPTLLVLIVFSFYLMRLAPGGPFTSEKPLPPSVMANVLERYGMDEPLHVQLWTYIKNIVFHFDFGPSFSQKDRTVNDVIAQGFPVTLTYGFWSAVFVLACGIPLGIIAALRHNSFWDYSMTGLAIFSQIFPNFVLAPIMVLLFTLSWGLLPGGGWNGGQWEYIIMPAVALGTSYMAGVARLTRGSFLEVMNSPFIRTARAKGLPERTIIIRHALKPALLPTLTYMGPVFVYMITGSVFIDVFFSTGGIGQDFIDGAYSRDYSMLLGLAILYSVLTFTLNLLLDLAYAWIDPKVRSKL
ncbi:MULTISPECIES: ABC transporter permease subunit [Tritonibacter]|uniref:ABC transporter permease subunit n=1 Tax=Tritonibacter scottomollicae TaxID=483013 RepID=A0A2T1APJ6_TRISK|nr:ABC transporter permease subunit [Tritonibacter scottomollicae]PRZ50238.1 oligopeptide transport system permease protein [Tritonibacter scottomollicae]WOI31622.1 ABC transporter permease subunit [Tritonibacter scottomollicae]